MEKKRIHKYWKEVVLLSFKNAFKRAEMKAAIIVIYSILLIIAVAGILLWAGLIPVNVFEDQVKNSVSGLASICVSTIFMLLLFAVLIYKTPAEIDAKKEQKIRSLEKKIKDPPELVELADIRKSGILLRNRGIEVTDEKELSLWVQEFENWNSLMVSAAKEYSPVRANILEILGNLPRGGYPNAVNELHRLKLNVFDERLKRLQALLEEHKPRKSS